MDQLAKDELRLGAQQHVHTVVKHIGSEIDKTSSLMSRLDDIIKGAEKGSHDEESVDIEKVLLQDNKARMQELKKLHGSPYFTKCVVKFDGDVQEKTIFVGKFPFFPDSISSWTTPIARLRYEEPGRFSYQNLNDRAVEGELKYKEQYMVVDGRIVFMAAEGVGQPRELIYQERLMRKKSDFSLPEIVEQMEKAQDEVIRAHWKGSYLISGPAGSGKTTLALHRVAYLTQAPETESIFPSHTIIVFVQDASTQKYFSNLLPELGITKVTITTFDAWAFEKLHLKNVSFVQKYGRNEKEKDLYEYAKNLALKKVADNVPEEKISASKDLYGVLLDYYREHLSADLMALFAHQMQENVMDRFDLSILLKCVLLQDGAITEAVPHYELMKRMKFKKTMQLLPLQYSLMVVDEAENFLAEQVEVLLSCVSKKTKAMLYVGDLAQQTRAYTLRDWNSVGEVFGEGRKVVLSKVYRNTRQILEYINSVGFKAVIPEGVNMGADVQEFVVLNKSQEIEKVEHLVQGRDGGIVGILAKTDEYLEAYRHIFAEHKDVRVMTINESQGVEFDAVFLVGVEDQYFGVGWVEASYIEELRHVNHDLLYVALTRAMNELYVLGREPLREIVERLKK